MANEEHLAILRQGVEMWNQWRRENEVVRPDLSKANLTGAVLVGVNLREANLQGTSLQGAVLAKASLEQVQLQRANLYRASFEGANLYGANLQEAVLQEVSLQGTILREANFEDANLEQASLQGASLQGAVLVKANLEQTDLFAADLLATLLERAYLRGAKLERAYLRGANLRETNLRGANLREANLQGANLQGADVTHARIYRTIFADVDLREVTGLETVKHNGPSEIAISTLYRSGGEIPEGFLRGCGVPDSMIEYARALVVAERPIDYYSCFISYSSADEALAKRLHADLQAAGVRCWYAPEDMKTGDSIIESIDHAIRLHEKLLLLLSQSSVVSRWVATEVKTALMREHNEGRTVLFPIRIDDAVMQSAQGWAAQLQERHITNFSGWKEHDMYEQAFKRLLRDLKAEGMKG